VGSRHGSQTVPRTVSLPTDAGRRPPTPLEALPKQVRYRTAPRPVSVCAYSSCITDRPQYIVRTAPKLASLPPHGRAGYASSPSASRSARSLSRPVALLLAMSVARPRNGTGRPPPRGPGVRPPSRRSLDSGHANRDLVPRVRRKGPTAQQPGSFGQRAQDLEPLLDCRAVREVIPRFLAQPEDPHGRSSGADLDRSIAMSKVISRPRRRHPPAQNANCAKLRRYPYGRDRDDAENVAKIRSATSPVVRLPSLVLVASAVFVQVPVGQPQIATSSRSPVRIFTTPDRS
jgi:hypothetical protein